MTTRNFHRDGDPAPGEIWACASQSPCGEFGIVIGCGSVKIVFVPEADIEQFLSLMVAESMSAEHIAMVQDARQDCRASSRR
jgi:hypothetical protein